MKEMNASNVPVARKYGSWMLVTRKSMEQDRRNKTKHANHKPKTRSNKGNTFAVLQRVEEEVVDDLHQDMSKDKGEQPKKGKVKSPTNTTSRGVNMRENPQTAKNANTQNKGATAGGKSAKTTAVKPTKVAHKPSNSGIFRTWEWRVSPIHRSQNPQTFPECSISEGEIVNTRGDSADSFSLNPPFQLAKGKSVGSQLQAVDEVAEEGRRPAVSSGSEKDTHLLGQLKSGLLCDTPVLRLCLHSVSASPARWPVAASPPPQVFAAPPRCRCYNCG
nr:hypothetical protein Iba_chr03dCG0640 [Ipomoea batatas]